MTIGHIASPSLPVFAALAVASVGLAQEIRLGDEFQVNSYTPLSQSAPSVATGGSGDFVVAWQSYGQDGSKYALFAQRFSSAGIALATEFQVSAYTTSHQWNPSVAALGSGDFVVAWQSDGQDGSSTGVFARRFSSAGVALATEFQVNSYTNDYQSSPSVAVSGSGDILVAWESKDQDGDSSGVFAREFSSSGVPVAAELQVSSYTTGYQRNPSVAVSAIGDFVIAWESGGQDGGVTGVFLQRFSSVGAALASELQVNSYTPGAQRSPSLVAVAGGDFVVAWQSLGQDGASEGVFARRFSSAGVALGAEFQVHSYTYGAQTSPFVAALAGGDFVVAWQSLGQDGSSAGVFARHFSSAGVGLAAEFQVHSYVTDSQSQPSVASGPSAEFVVAWQSLGQDGSSEGVFAQRFLAPAVLDVDGNGSTGALTDGLLILRYLFGFRDAALVGGAVGVGCRRCSAGEIEEYIVRLV